MLSAQNLNNISVTDSINCYGDSECVDMNFSNLDLSASYNLWIWRDIGDGNYIQLSDIFENFTSSADFVITGISSGYFNYCFELNGDYKIEIVDSNEVILSDFLWTTDTWPANTNITQLSSNTNLLCQGDSLGSIKIAGTGGEPPLIFSWSGPNGYNNITSGSVISNIQNLVAGVYFLTLTDANGCQNTSFTTSITEPSPIQATFIQDQLESCLGSNDAQITAYPSGGNGAPYSFLWDSGDTTSSITTGAGLHTLVVKDSQNCTSTSNLSINLDPIQELTFTLQIIDAECVGQSGFVEISTTGGNPPYQYQWPNGSSTVNTNNLIAGNYNITITDQNNCSTTAIFSIQEPDSISTSIINTIDASCFGVSDGSIDIVYGGGTANYEIDFFKDGVLSPILPNSNFEENITYTISNLSQGDYQIITTDANNCSTEGYPLNFTINEPLELTVDDTLITNVLCFNEQNGSIITSISGGSGNYNYNWSDANNAILGGNSNSIYNLGVGLYNLNVDDGFCNKDFSFNIIEPNVITLVSSSFNNVSCLGANDGSIFNTIASGGTAPYNYIWQNTEGQIYNEANPSLLAPSVYSLNVVDFNNCQSFLINHTITQPTAISIFQDEIISPPSCHNAIDGFIQMIAIGGTPAYTYNLTEINSGITYNSNFASNLSAGNYIFTITDANNCLYDTTFIFQNPLDLEFSTSSVDLTCFNSNDGKLYFDYNNVNPPYNIDFEGQTVIDSVVALAANVYTTTLTDGNGCQKTLIDTINQPSQIEYNSVINLPSCHSMDLSQTNLISNGQIILNLSGGSGFYDVILGTDTTQSQSGIPYFVNNLSAGSYDFEVIDSDGCNISFNQIVGEPEQIIIYSSVSNLTVFGANDGQIDITVVGGVSPYQYEWIGPNGFISTQEDISNLSSGVYTLVITDANGCTESKELAVNQPSCAIVISPNIQQVNCPGDNAIFNFTLTNGIAPYSCFMQGDIDNDGTNDTILPNTLINSSLSLPLTLPSGNEYTLIVEDNSSCFKTYNLVIPDVQDFSINPEIIDVSCYGLSDGMINIDPLNDISGGTPPYFLTWEGLDLNPVSPFNLSAGQYIVTVSDSLDCNKPFYYTINEPSEIVLADTIISHPNCLPLTNSSASDGQITLIAQGGNTNGTGLYQYFWQDPSITSIQNPTNLAPGIYEVSIEDQNNCVSSPFFISLNSPELIQYSYYSTIPISCNDACNGSFTVITENVENESFSWFNLNDTVTIGYSNTINNLCEGSYTFSVENTKGCYVESPSLGIGNLSLANPNEFSINISHSNSVPFGICNGIASVTSTAGVSPLSYNWSTGDTTSTVDSLCGSTIYSLEVTDANGCSSFEQFIINENSCSFSMGSATVIQPSCTDQNDAQISISSFTGGFGPYKIQMYNSDLLINEFFTYSTNLSFSNLASGNYNIIVEESGGCLDMLNVQIVNPLPFNISYNISNTECYSSYQPLAHINIEGGTPYSASIPYNIEFFGYEGNFTFEQGGTEQFISGNSLTSGNYPIIVSDANGCNSPIFTISVDPLDSLLVNVNTNAPLCAGQSTATASLSISGGNEPYIINWYEVGQLSPLNDSQTDMILMDSLSAGNYFVSVTDQNNCESIVNFTIVDPSPITVTSVVSPPSCAGLYDASINTNVSGGSGNYNFMWSPGSYNSSNISNVSAGTYDLIIYDDLGCEQIKTIVVSDPADITINLQTTDVSCYNYSNGAITATTSNTNNQYQWYINGLPISALNGGTSPSIMNLSPANYTVEVTTANNCIFTASDNIIEPAALEILETIIEPSCYEQNDGIINAQVSGGVGNYSYSLSDNTSTVISNTSQSAGLIAGNYVFTVTDQNNCSTTENYILNQPNDIIINLNTSNVSCYNGQNGWATFSTLNTNGEISQVWSKIIDLNNFQPISFADTVQNLIAANYNLELTDSLGCSQSQTFSITQPNPIVVNVITTPSQCTNTNQASAQVSSTGVSPVNYLWTINQGGTITQNGNYIQNLGPGTIYLNGTDANGCSLPLTTVQIPESNNPLIQVNIVENEFNICHGQTNAQLEADLFYDDGSTVNGNVTYQWYINDNLIPASEGGVINILSNLGEGEYTIEVSDNNFGCINTSSIVLQNPNELLLEVVNIQDINCYGQDVGAATAIVSNGSNPILYDWNNSMGVVVANDISNPNNLVAGNYQLTITDNNGCQNTKSFDILQNDSITFNINAISTSCFGSADGTLILSNPSGGVGPYTYECRNEAQQIVSNSTFTDGLSSQMYYVKVSDSFGCYSVDSIFINQPDLLVIEETITNISCYGQQTGSISLNILGGNGIYNYEWNDDNSINSNLRTGLAAGIYSITVTDQLACSTNSSFSVTEEQQIEVLSEGIFESCTEGYATISNITGGVSPFTIYWDDNPLNFSTTLTNLPPGMHVFHVFDQNNCEFTDSVLISGTNDIITTINVTENVGCYGESSGEITINIVNDDNYPYMYSINNNSSFQGNIVNNSFTIDNLDAGSYTIFIKDGEDCIDTTQLVVISQPQALSFSSEVTNIDCYSDSSGIVTINTIGGVGGYDISINNINNTIINNSSGLDTILLASGNYSIIVTDNNNCSYSQSVDVLEPQPLEFSISNLSNYNGYNVSCYNSNNAHFEVQVSGGVGGYILSYLDTSFNIIQDQIIDNLSPGAYEFSVSDSNHCITQLDTIITAPDTLDFTVVSISDFNGTNISCFGQNDGSIEFVSNGGIAPYDYSSNGGISYQASNTFSQYVFNNLISGDHTFVVRDINGCIETYDFEFIEPTLITTSLNVLNTIDCYSFNQGQLLAQVQGGTAAYEYVFSSINDTITVNSVENSILFENLNAGFYELNIIDANGCSNTISAASQIVIGQPNELSYNLNINTPSCFGESDAQLNLNSISGGSAPYTVKLYDLFGFFLQENNVGTFDNINLNSLSNTNLTLVITDQNGCELIDTIEINQPDILDVSLEISNLSCPDIDNGTISASIIGGTSPYSFQLNNQEFNTNNTIEITELSDTSYSIVVTDLNGCDYSTEVVLTQPEQLSISMVQENNPCYDQSIGWASFNVSGGTGPYTYVFTDMSGLFISDSNYVSNLGAGNYLFEVTDSNLCNITQELSISQAEDLIVTHEIIHESCLGASDGSIMTTVSNFQGNYELFWQNESLSGTLNNNLSPGDYIVTTIDGNNCFKVDTINIEPAQPLVMILEIQHTSCSYINNGQLNINLDGTQNFQAQLSNPDYSQLSSSYTDIEFNDIAQGDYVLSISYDSICTLDTNITITSYDGYNCITIEPTFSPNFDGQNDVFSPLQNFGEQVELLIFNRWGEMIFQQENINPTWDGVDLNGTIAPSADYYYIVKFNNQLYNDITGVITLLK